MVVSKIEMIIKYLIRYYKIRLNIFKKQNVQTNKTRLPLLPELPNTLELFLDEELQ
jgi:hypothetical protein